VAFKFNNAFFDDLSVSPEVTALCVEVAEDVAQIARTTAPDGWDGYVEGIEVTTKRQKRSVAVVEATNPKSMIVESKYGVLARALRSAKKRG